MQRDLAVSWQNNCRCEKSKVFIENLLNWLGKWYDMTPQTFHVLVTTLRSQPLLGEELFQEFVMMLYYTDTWVTNLALFYSRIIMIVANCYLLRESIVYAMLYNTTVLEKYPWCYMKMTYNFPYNQVHAFFYKKR